MNEKKTDTSYEDYIKPEIICGWEVSETTKKVWWFQVDLIKQLDNICKKHNLQWFPMWGTLLGAIRHKGFIPWDDDVDIVMFRKDYDRLVEICKSELMTPYYLQTTLDDKDCFYMWSSLRNSNTTGNRITCLSKRQNNGIGIDIMPLDGCENSFTRFRISRYPVRVLSVFANTFVNDFNMSKKARILRIVLRALKFNYKKAFIIAENWNRKFKCENYKKVAFRAHSDGLYNGKNLYKDMWEKKYFQNTVLVPFENIQVPVPVDYDKLLKYIYGDYMKYPPLDRRKGKHDVVFEPDIPYKQYCREHYGVEYD